MDAKITKKRLADYLSYEWIVIAVISVVVIALWGFLYGVVLVKPATGQRFCYYYDMNVSNENDEAFLSLLKDKKTFSYDVREIYSEMITSKQVLLARCANYEADAIFTSIEGQEKDGYRSNRANEIIDSFDVYALDDAEGGLLYDAIEYLKGFLRDKNLDPLVYENLDKELIKQNFESRINESRSYRNYKRAGQITVEEEYQRIERLCEEVSFYKKVVEYDKTLAPTDSIFYCYTKYEMAFNESTQATYDENKLLFEQETERPYAIKLIKLADANANKAVSEYFKDAGANSDNMVLEIFNFKNQQKDMQFESISFINTIIRNYSCLAEKIG